MKKCCLCKQEKSLDEFNKKNTSRDGLQSVCRDCNKEKSRDYYRSNLDKHKKETTKRKKQSIERNRRFLAQYLQEHPCVDCGIADIRVLEFDHLNGPDKINGVARMAVDGCALKTIHIEIQKCEVRCRNCHTIKTYDRMGGSWHNNFILPAPVA